jgi:hypothetical protein
VTDEQVDRWTRWQTIIEIPHLEPASVGDTTPTSKLASQIEGDWRHIHSEHAHASIRQPHRHLPTPGGDLKSGAGRWEQTSEESEHLRWTGLAVGLTCSGVPLIPTSAIFLAHARTIRFVSIGEVPCRLPIPFP